MDGIDNFKITDARQAKVISNFKDIKQKLRKTNAAIWFSKVSRIIQLTPEYTQIKIKSKNRAMKSVQMLLFIINGHQQKAATD